MRQIQMLHGKGISELSAAGPLRFYDRPPLAPVIHSSRTPQEEWKRFLAARHDAILELAALCDVVISRLGQDLANIFFAHAVLMEDDDLTAMVKQDIFTGMTAEYAVYRVCDHFVMEFQALHDPYMQARAMDILDVSRRLFRALEGWRTPCSGGQPFWWSPRFSPARCWPWIPRSCWALLPVRAVWTATLP